MGLSKWLNHIHLTFLLMLTLLVTVFLKSQLYSLRDLSVIQCPLCAGQEIGKLYIKNQIEIVLVSQPLSFLWLLPSTDVWPESGWCVDARVCSDGRQPLKQRWARGGPWQGLMPPVLEK